MKVDNKLNVVVIVVALAMTLYHLVSSQVLLQSTDGHLNTHLGFCLILVFLSSVAKSQGKIRRLWSLVLALLALVTIGYVQVLWPELQIRSLFNTTTDLVIGAIIIILVLEATRREFGLILPLLTIIVVIYPFLGTHLLEPLHTSSLGLEKTISNLSVALGGGVYKFLSASANFIFLFVVFGGVLQGTGAAAFFLRLSRLVVGRLRGGPALMAVVSSSLVGSVVGSAAANVAITGAFTIPLMKKTGYKPYQAGAIEAAASNGGQIMPPIMGVSAFAMAGITGIPYLQIVIMAIIPALLYYLCAGAYVYLRAGQLRIGMMTDEKTDIRELLLTAPLFAVPFTVIIVLLVMGYSVIFVAFWAVISSVAAALIRKKSRPSLHEFINGFVQGAKAGAAIGVTVACVGLIASTFTMSGLGVKMSAGIEAWSGGYLILGLLIVWVLCVILGMGGASLTAYLIVSIFAVPAIMKLGVPLEQAHFFTMFVAVFAFLTPPIALVSMVAAKLAGAPYMKTAIESTKVAAAGFLLPFMFIYCPLLLLQPQQPIIGVMGIVASIMAILALQVGFVGYYFGGCSMLKRIIAFAAATSLLAFLPLKSPILFVLGIAVFIILTFWEWRKYRGTKLSTGTISTE